MDNKNLPRKLNTAPVHLANTDNVYDKKLKMYQSRINQILMNGGGGNGSGSGSAECNCESITNDELNEILN